MSGESLEPMAVAVAVGEPLGSRVLDGRAELRPVGVPGVDGTVVWAVRDDGGPHPMQLYVGRWPDGSVRVLTNDQEAWAELIEAVGAHLTSERQAREHVERYLEVTRAPMVIVRPVVRLEDLRWRPGSDDEEAAKAALLASAPDLEPVTYATPTGFHVELALIVDQRLQRNRFDVTRSGRISADYRILALDLPLPIAR